MTTDHLPSPDAIPVELLGLDEFETGLLSILRHFLTAFTRPETQAWQTAHAVAAERWGEARGPQIAQGLLAVLHAVRGSRRADFHYANPLCVTCRAYATAEEGALMQMLQAMRRDRSDLARVAVLQLTEGTMDPVLIQSGLAFSNRYPADAADMDALPALVEKPTHMPAARRHLRLVH